MPSSISAPPTFEHLRALAGDFDDGRALHDVEALCAERFAGRRVGTAGHDAARAWLAGRLRSLGLGTETVPFRLDVPVLDLFALPTLEVLDPSGGAKRRLQHRVEFTPHPRSANAPDPIDGVARRGATGTSTAADGDLPEATGEHLQNLQGAWVLLDAVPQGDALETFARRIGGAGAVGILVPQLPNADGFLVKRIAGQSPVDLPILSVRADLLPQLEGLRACASAPVRREYAEGGHVLGRLIGADESLAAAPLIVGAHYDGVGDDGPAGSGGHRLPCATDNAAGVAVVLEVARVLVARGERPRRPIVFAAFDAEEVNAAGARAYAGALRAAGLDGAMVVNLDGAARIHDVLTVEPGRGAEPLLVALDRAGEALEIPLAAGPISSDHRRFTAAGFPAVGLSVGLAGIHTPADTPARVEPEAMRRAGSLLLATIWQLAFGWGANATR